MEKHTLQVFNQCVRNRNTGMITKIILENIEWFRAMDPFSVQEILGTFNYERLDYKKYVRPVDADRLVKLARRGAFSPHEIKPYILAVDKAFPRILIEFHSRFPETFTAQELRAHVTPEQLLTAKKELQAALQSRSMTKTYGKHKVRDMKRALQIIEQVEGLREEFHILEVMDQ